MATKGISNWELSTMAKQELRTKGVPGGIAPENVHVIQSGSSLASGSHGQPLGVPAYSNSRVKQYDVGRANFQTPVMGVQSPAGAGALQNQHIPGAMNLQTRPGDPQNPPMYASSQSQGGMAFGSFLAFDPKKFINMETRTLGVIQILIGLIHIFSAVKPLQYYQNSITALSGYPVWGGVSFIISGSLSVHAEKDPNPCVVPGSVAMNVVSAIFSLAGISIHLVDMFNLPAYGLINPNNVLSSVFSSSLFPFALLEFCLACVVSHLGCLAVCSNKYLYVTPVPVAANANAVNAANTTNTIDTANTTNPAGTATSPVDLAYCNA